MFEVFLFIGLIYWVIVGMILVVQLDTHRLRQKPIEQQT